MARRKKRCRRDINEEKIDRISELPEPILHHIFSSLGPQEECLQFRASSKRLNEVWTTLPYLNLGRDLFHSMRYHHGEEERYNKEKRAAFDKMLRRRKLWFTFVDKTLASRVTQGLTIKTFQLGVTELDDELSGYLGRWIESLVKYCKIEELVLYNNDKNGGSYDLPPIMLTSTTLTSLTLLRCTIPHTDIKLFSLRNLCLNLVCVDDEVMGDIIRSCCNLEYLELWCCNKLKRLHVSRLCQLKFLNLNFNSTKVDKILVEAPTLEKLKFSGDDFPHTINLSTTCTRNLKNLQFVGHTITTRYLADLVSNLLVLEVLTLARLHLEAIEISSRSLKRLALYDLFGFEQSGVCEAKIDAPSLVCFTYSGYLSHISLSNNLAVPQVNLKMEDIRRRSTDGEDTFSKMTQFLHKFDYSETVKLSLFSLEKIIFSMEKRAKTAAPLPNVKHLVIYGLFGKPVRAIMARVIDNLLWFFPGLNTLLIMDRDYLEPSSDPDPVKLSAKFTHDKFTGIEDHECCDCINLSQRCWRHSLKHLKYELQGATVDAKDDRCLRNYFTDNAMLLEDIEGSFGPL